MMGVGVTVKDDSGSLQHYAYECHTPETLAAIVSETVCLLPEGWSMESVEVV